MRLNGAEAIMEILLEHDVDTVFGYPGGAALNLYDALYKYSDKIEHVLHAHEQGASHAADGYARATGKTGVVIATSGPGATNLVTGIATAFMDSIPMVAITANVNDNLIGRDAFQEVFISGIVIPVTKHTYLVRDINDLEDSLRNAFRIANSGRKGPVLIDITKDVTADLINYKPGKPLPINPTPSFTDSQVRRVADMINVSERPVIYCGGGVATTGAQDLVCELMDKSDIPAAHTLMSAGCIGYDNPLSLGMAGMHGTIASNKAFDRADLIISIGARFSDRVALNTEKFGKRANIIHIDIDAGEINKNVIVDCGVVADAKEFLTELLPKVKERERREWVSQTTSWKAMQGDARSSNSELHPSEIIDSVCTMTDKDTIYVTDVGQHQMWAAQYLKHTRTRQFITSGGLGTMGFGYGAAIGAQKGCPDSRVIHFTGDGSFHMNMNEACTAVSQNLPIITIIMNNSVLGMVYQWQTAFYHGRYSSTDPHRKTDFPAAAEAFGAKGYRARTLDEFKNAFAEALKSDGPVWIECQLAKDERVLPMIPAGGTLEDMIIG